MTHWRKQDMKSASHYKLCVTCYVTIPKLTISQSEAMPIFLISCNVKSLILYGYDFMDTWPILGKLIRNCNFFFIPQNVFNNNLCTKLHWCKTGLITLSLSLFYEPVRAPFTNMLDNKVTCCLPTLAYLSNKWTAILRQLCQCHCHSKINLICLVRSISSVGYKSS